MITFEDFRDKRMAYAFTKSVSDDPKDQDAARKIRTQMDYDDLKKQIGSKKKPTKAAVAESEVVSELNRYEKETGKSSGSLNMPKGKPTEKGGTKDRVMRAVRTSIRRETGRPEGQQKKERGKKPPVAGEYGARRSPEQIVQKRRADKASADAAMSDTRGT